MGQQQMSATSASNINRKAVTSAIVDSMNSLKLQSEQNRDNDVLTGDPAVGAVRSNYF
jgi:hypothetical protein